jgi:sarcosine oxidase subunit beta
VLFNTVIGGQICADGAQDRRADPSRRFIHDSAETLARLFPALRNVPVLRSWSRFESVSPDGRFLAGETAVPGLYVAAGCNGSGFLRAPMLAEVIRDRLLGRSAWPEAELYAPGRFAGAAA